MSPTKRGALAMVLGLAWAAPPAVAVAGEGAVEQAMKDELARSLAELQVPGEPRPYYIAYTFTDVEEAEVNASFGAVTVSEKRRRRFLRVDMRVGDPKLDHSNFSARYSTPEYSSSEAALDDDYGSVRRLLWRRTDDAFRAALERLSAKKGAAERQSESADAVPDFWVGAPAVNLTHAPPATGAVPDPGPLAGLAARLTSIFRAHAGIQRSTAFAQHTVLRRRFVSSEKSFIDEKTSNVRLDVRAETQAGDGMPLWNAAWFRALEPRGLLGPELMGAEVERRAAELEAARTAPLATSGDAVVLFEGPAATDIVWRLLADHLSGTPPARTAEGDERREGSLADRLGQRVAPSFLSVHDDPSVEHMPDGRGLFGAYRTDDEGVAAERVKLIDKGVLTGLLMSRTPSRDLGRSNGHGRGTAIDGSYQGRFANLFVTGGAAALDARRLRQKALAVAREMGPRTSVYVVRLMDDEPVIAFHLTGAGEKPVRGLMIEGLSSRRLKDLVAVGDTPYVSNLVRFGQASGVRGMPSSIVAPPLLFKDLEVRRDTRKFPKPPLYEHPHFARPKPAK